MTSENQKVAVGVKKWKLEKRNADGEVFETVEGGENQPPRVTSRRPGEPAESYARLPDHPERSR